ENLGTVRRQKEIRGFDVAMNDALRVSGVQRICQGQGHVDDRRDVEWAPTESMLERLAVEQLHRDKRRIIAGVVDGADLWMIEAGGSTSLALEPLENLRRSR